MNICICCHTQLLHHLNQSRSYWFCPNCYQEMPNIFTVIIRNQNRTKAIHFEEGRNVQQPMKQNQRNVTYPTLT